MPHAPTPEQRRAIEAPAGPVLVVAGPGAGKTFCLIERVRHLLGPLGLAPERICAITFTNKAADEISHRLSAEVGPAARHVTRGTLHALCLKLLREFPEAVGLRPGFGVADEEYQRALLRLFRVKDEACGRVLTLFGRARHEERATLEPSLDRLFGRYRETLHRRNLVDFDDLIVHAKTLLETDAARRAEIAGRWDAILVDEFQDLTPTQYRIVALLAQDHRHVFGVGDDEQAIYGWAGADAGILKVFQQEFGIPEEIVLTTNHRNSRAIFDAARRLVQTNPSLFHKQLVARHEGMFPVEVRTFPDERAEVEWLVADLRADREAHGLAWGDVAVLVRAHRLGQRLETALLRARVPVRAARGRAIAEDPIAGPVLAAFRLVQSPADQVPVELLARRFLTAEMLEVLRARYPGMHLVRALRQYDNEPSTPKPEGRRAMRLFYHVTNLPGLARTARSLGDFVDALLEQRPSERRTPLEERADDLTDPEELPAVRDLADGLRRVRERGARIHLRPDSGAALALREMLVAGGFGPFLVRRGADPGPGDLVLDAAGAPGMTLRLFKALQRLDAAGRGLRLDECVTFDMETTGTDVDRCAIVEIGAARVRAGRVVERFHALVDPGVPIPEEATQVHGWTDADLAGKPSFTEVWPAFRGFVGEDLLVAHNGRHFDVPVLLRHVRAAGDDAWHPASFDTLPLARSVIRESARLPDLAKRFGVDPGRSHHADADAETLAEVLDGLIRTRAAFLRRTAFQAGLDWLGVGLALERGERTPEEELLFEIGRVYALGRYSDCLERYAAAREEAGGDTEPTVDELVDRLGGRGLMARLRARRSTADRYPSSVLRLRRLLEDCEHLPVEEGIAAALDLIALSARDGFAAADGAVSLLTLHATKGLEFSRVYIVGVEDHQIPGYHAVTKRRHDEFPEARRTLYVGMTRARDRLVLTRAREREGRPTGGAMFLEEMDLLAPAPAEPADRGVPWP